MSLTVLVEGRACGPCTQCCIVPAIDKPEIQKDPSSACIHCGGAGGCAIYQTRPQVCRTYYCAWRRLAIFDEDWRPDKSGIFAEIEGDGLCLTLVGNPLKTIRTARFIDFVAAGIRRRTPLYLGLPGPRGMLGAKLRLSGDAMEAAARATAPRTPMRALLEQALARLSAHAFQPNRLVHGGQDVSS